MKGWALRLHGVGNASAVELGSAMSTIERDGVPWLTIDCGAEGTVNASQGPLSPLGLAGLRGNLREWTSNCTRGCQRRLAAGMGWRDPADRSSPGQSNDFDADTGFDDIGFRLVREVSAAELGAR